MTLYRFKQFTITQKRHPLQTTDMWQEEEDGEVEEKEMATLMTDPVTFN